MSLSSSSSKVLATYLEAETLRGAPHAWRLDWRPVGFRGLQDKVRYEHFVVIRWGGELEYRMIDVPVFSFPWNKREECTRPMRVWHGVYVALDLLMAGVPSHVKNGYLKKYIL